MKKKIAILIIGILIVSGFGATATEDKSETLVKINSISINIPSLKIESDDDKTVELSLEGVSTYILNPGEPILPKIVKTIELPFGSKNIRVEITPNEIQEKNIAGIVKAAPAHLPLNTISKNIVKEQQKDEEIYSSNDPYPSNWYSYSIRAGLNEFNEIKNHLTIHIYPVKYIPAQNTINVIENADIKISYENPKSTPFKESKDDYDMVIIAPELFERALQPLVDHKNDVGVKTFLKTTEEIYEDYDGADKPEQIKYFIKESIEENGIIYVLLVGGLKSQIWNNPRENRNYGAKYWYVPVRYNNLYDDPAHPLSAEKIHDPGVITDLYYSDIYDSEGNFSDWDTNDDGVFAAYRLEGYEDDLGIDMEPDVMLGRLACRNIFEVKTVVNKIINYESVKADDSWFKKLTIISGDGFLDQEDLNFIWDTNGLPKGKYTIYAQSINDEGIAGPIDEIEVTVDHDKNTRISFNHNDHLITRNYPYPPIAEIVCPSNYNVLGKDDFFENTSESQAYCNAFNGWGNQEYVDGIMHIRGKSYDPQPYGNITHIHVWIKNSDSGETVFSDWRNNTKMYYEGEWICGDQVVMGGGGAAYYMPEDFEIDTIFASNGEMKTERDFMNAFNEGAGFLFMSGHGSPNSWGDHFPGVPGNRMWASFTGTAVTTIKGYPPFIGIPLFPMSKLKNFNKLPVVLIGGCHNSQFNVSIFPGVIDWYNRRNTWCHGAAIPECFSWYLVKMPGRGAIATIGNTGLGYGVLGETTTVDGLDGGICIEFFKQYADLYNQSGYGILGETYTQTLINYTQTFDMEFLDHIKSLQQWVLLGDPSLRMGGYSS